MNCIIVDDEKLARDLMEDNIRRVPYLQLQHTCKNALEAAGALHTEHVDLIFLDVQMPELNGLDFLRSLPNPPMVILVSAYDSYALKGFDLNVVDYLVKPVSFERFLTACNRAQELFALKQAAPTKSAPAQSDFFFVSVEYGSVKVAFQDILYVEGMKDYIKIYVASSAKPVTTRMTIKDLEKKLSSRGFIRIHKSFLVPVGRITRVQRDLLYVGSKELPVGESYKEDLNRILKNPTL
ncbi:MAG: LytTR family DNA-binding domain-containing protein [Ignavibacteriae bacterium]|nr:LytTR family DNA-binding domain-containing protein [Ignavibacteriota bacterium]